MPIYEFFCKKCNTIYKFYSRTIDTETVPKCPVCKRVKLERVFSSFATLSAKTGEGSEAAMPDIDESKLQKAMAMLEKESGTIDQDDPRQAADLMRKLTDASGISLGPGMEEALARIESGEDPDKIEEEMGELLEEESLELGTRKKGSKKNSKPVLDDKLYDL